MLSKPTSSLRDHRVRLLRERLRALLHALVDVSEGNLENWAEVLSNATWVAESAIDVVACVRQDATDAAARTSVVLAHEHASAALSLAQRKHSLVPGELGREIALLKSTVAHLEPRRDVRS
jgi:hypothetical protein